MSSGGSGSVKETPEEKDSAKLAVDQYDDFKKRWLPLQSESIRRVRSSFKPLSALASATAKNDVDAAFGTVGKTTTENAAARGIGIGSGRSRAASADIDAAQAKSAGLSAVSADLASTERYQRQLEGLVATGRGQQAAGTAGLRDIAGLSRRVAENDAQIAADNASAKAQFAGSVISSGIGAYGAKRPGGGLNPKTWGTDAGGAGAGGDTW